MSCFLDSKPRMKWDLESLKFINTLPLCEDHKKIVSETIEKLTKPVQHASDREAPEPGTNG